MPSLVISCYLADILGGLMFSKKKWKRGEDRKEGGEAVDVLYKNKFKNIFKNLTI